LNSTNFDRGYVTSMYTQHAVTAAVASMGAQRVSDPRIRSLSMKIANEQVDMNNKLNAWYSKVGGGPLVADQTRVSCATAALCGLDQCSFDRIYAATMVELLRQSSAAAFLGATRSTSPDLRYQARMVDRISANEIAAFRAWQPSVSVYPQTPACPG